MNDVLFEGFEALPVEPVEVEKLSADRRRTLRQRKMVAAERHPLTGGRAYPDLGTCGDCRWREVIGHHDRSYPKCVFPGTVSAEEYERHGGFRVTHGAASDVRAWWPACSDHELGDPKVGPDASRQSPALSVVVDVPNRDTE